VCRRRGAVGTARLLGPDPCAARFAAEHDAGVRGLSGDVRVADRGVRHVRTDLGERVRDEEARVHRDRHAIARVGFASTEQREQRVAGDELAALVDRHHPIGVAVVNDPEVRVGGLDDHAGRLAVLGRGLARPSREPPVSLGVERLHVTAGRVERVGGD